MAARPNDRTVEALPGWATWRIVMSSGYRIALAKRDHLEQLQQIELAAAALFSEEDVPEHIRSMATSPDLLTYPVNVLYL